MGTTLRGVALLLGLGLGLMACGGDEGAPTAGGPGAAGDHVPGHGRPGGDARLQGARRPVQDGHREHGQRRRGARARRAPGQAHDLVLGGQAARGLPAQLPLPGRVRGPRRDRCRRPAPGRLGGLQARGLLPDPDGGVRVPGRAAVRAAERLVAGGLLQRRRVQGGRHRAARRLVDLRRVRGGGGEADRRWQARRRPRPEHDPRRPVGVGRGRRARGRPGEPDEVPVRHAARAGAGSNT